MASGGLITTLLELCFADIGLGATLDLSALGEEDPVKLLFSENTAVVFQSRGPGLDTDLKKAGIPAVKIGKVNTSGVLSVQNLGDTFEFSVAAMRDSWFYTSYLLDSRQTAGNLAKTRYKNYKKQSLAYTFPGHFDGVLDRAPIKKAGKPKAAILREKGSNSEREMANAMYLAGFEVKDVHMTDLISGREDLEDIQFIGAVGGFSNSDVLGSAKGWAGAIKYNEKANMAIRNFFNRPDTLSIGICNGCQLFMELELIHPELKTHGKLTYNDSGKHESNFTSVRILKNNSVMLSSLEGAVLGIWVSHGEGKFRLPLARNQYDIVAQYGYNEYPANPNGSDYNTAMLSDATGRHLVTMPHLERSIFPWNWAYYPGGRKDQVSPWLQAFINARVWIEAHRP